MKLNKEDIKKLIDECRKLNEEIIEMLEENEKISYLIHQSERKECLRILNIKE